MNTIIPAAFDPLVRDAVARWTAIQWAWLFWFVALVLYVALAFVDYCDEEEDV